MNIHFPACRVVVCGVTGTGKTTFAERWIRTSASDKVLIYDWQEFEFANRLGVEPITSWDELGELWENPNKKLFPFDPGGDMEEDLEDICEFLFDVQSDCRNVVDLVCDEVGGVLVHGKLNPTIKDMLTKGRRWQVNMLLICHQPNEIHNAVRNHVTEIACFQQIDKKLAIPSAASYGLDGEQLETLRVGEFVYRCLRPPMPPVKKKLF